jgi:hypothetical protein
MRTLSVATPAFNEAPDVLEALHGPLAVPFPIELEVMVVYGGHR